VSIVRSHPAVRFSPGVSGDVVAGLLNDGQADAVAAAAVTEAVRRGARLRFVQVVDDGLSPEERADADQHTFRSAVRALRGVRGLPCRFEVVTGDPTDTLIELSASAAALIIGAHRGRGAELADRCRADAPCPVIVVDGPSAA